MTTYLIGRAEQCVKCWIVLFGAVAELEAFRFLLSSQGIPVSEWIFIGAFLIAFFALIARLEFSSDEHKKRAIINAAKIALAVILSVAIGYGIADLIF